MAMGGKEANRKRDREDRKRNKEENTKSRRDYDGQGWRETERHGRRARESYRSSYDGTELCRKSERPRHRMVDEKNRRRRIEQDGSGDKYGRDEDMSGQLVDSRRKEDRHGRIIEGTKSLTVQDCNLNSDASKLSKSGGVYIPPLIGTDALPWHVLSYIRLTQEDTTSSSRIFIKFLFQEFSEHLGISLLNEQLNDPTMQDSFESIFPKDNPKNTQFSINFFTSMGLGGLTENLREYLKNMPHQIMQQQKLVSDSDSNDESGSSDSSDSRTSSSESELD